jgi:hypothetical protein
MADLLLNLGGTRAGASASWLQQRIRPLLGLIEYVANHEQTSAFKPIRIRQGLIVHRI